MKYSYALAALSASSLLAACGNAAPEAEHAAPRRHAAPAAGHRAPPPSAQAPTPRNADGLFPACEAYVNRLKNCYRKLPAAEAAPYRATLKETAASLKEADAQACRNINRDFDQTARTLHCE